MAAKVLVTGSIPMLSITKKAWLPPVMFPAGLICTSKAKTMDLLCCFYSIVYMGVVRGSGGNAGMSV